MLWNCTSWHTNMSIIFSPQSEKCISPKFTYIFSTTKHIQSKTNNWYIYYKLCSVLVNNFFLRKHLDIRKEWKEDKWIIQEVIWIKCWVKLRTKAKVVQNISSFWALISRLHCSLLYISVIRSQLKQLVL